MRDLLIFDDNDVLVQVLSNETKEAIPFWRAIFKKTVNEAMLFEFVTLADSGIMEGEQVAFLDEENVFRLFKITRGERILDASGAYVRWLCADALLDLDFNILQDIRATDVSLSTALARALDGQDRWLPGNIDDAGIGRTNFFFESSVSAIGKILDAWNVEVSPRITIDGNRITGRFVDMGHIGEQSHLLLEVGHNVEGMTFTVDKSDIRTLLIGRGSSVPLYDDEGEATGGHSRRITFEDEEATLATHGFVKPRGQIFLADEEARQLYGIRGADGRRQHLEGVHNENVVEVPDTLMRMTWEALKRQSRPTYHVEINMADISRLAADFSHEHLSLGDTVRLRDDETFDQTILIETRVMSIQYDLADPDSTVIHLGNYRNLYRNNRLPQLEREIEHIGSRPIPDQSGNLNPTPGPITNLHAIPFLESIAVMWGDQGVGMIFELFASRTAGFTPNNGNRIFNGFGNGYHHMGVGMHETWFYRARATNSRGDVGPMSGEIMARTMGFPDFTGSRELIDQAQAAFNNAYRAIDDAAMAMRVATGAVNAAGNAQSAADRAQNIASDAKEIIDGVWDAIDALTASFQDEHGNLFDIIASASGYAIRAENARGDALNFATSAQGSAQTATSAAGNSTTHMLTAQQMATSATNAAGQATTAVQTAQGFANQASNAAGQASSLLQTANGLMATVTNNVSGLTTRMNVQENSFSTFVAQHGQTVTSIIQNTDIIDMPVRGQSAATFFQLANGRAVIRSDAIVLDGQTTVLGTFRVNGDMINDGTLLSRHITAQGLDAGVVRFGTMTGVNFEAVNINGSVVNGGQVNGSAISMPNTTAPNRIMQRMVGNTPTLGVFSNGNELLRMHPVVGQTAAVIDIHNTNNALMGIFGAVVNTPGQNGVGIGAANNHFITLRSQNFGGSQRDTFPALTVNGNNGQTTIHDLQTAAAASLSFTAFSGSALFTGSDPLQLDKDKPLQLSHIKTTGYYNNGSIYLSRHLVDGEPVTMIGDKRTGCESGYFIGDDGVLGARFKGKNYICEERDGELKWLSV